MKIKPYRLIKQIAFWCMIGLVIWTSFVYAPYMKERECCPCPDWHYELFEPDKLINFTENQQGGNETNYSFYMPDPP